MYLQGAYIKKINLFAVKVVDYEKITHIGWILNCKILILKAN